MSEAYSKAYSLEVHDYLEPAEAYEKSIKKSLKRNNAFQCSENCTFQLVLVNFGKDNFVKEPYYRSAKLENVHSIGCDVVRKAAKARIGERESSYIFERKDNTLTIQLDLVNGLLADISESKKILKTPATKSINQYSKTNQTSSEDKEKRELTRKIKSLKRLIDYYERMKQGELYNIVDKNGNPIDLNDYFQDLRIDPTIKQDEVKIYIADALVYLQGSKENPYYHLKVTNECVLSFVSTKPTLNINKKNSVHKGVASKEKFLEKRAKEGKKYKIYFFGSFVLRESNNHFYINFDLNTQEALDFLVFFPY